MAWSGSPDLAAALRARNDAHFRAPRPLAVTFRPKRNRAYQSRFRVEVEGGEGFDVVLSGKGTYLEDAVGNPGPKVGPRMFAAFERGGGGEEAGAEDASDAE